MISSTDFFAFTGPFREWRWESDSKELWLAAQGWCADPIPAASLAALDPSLPATLQGLTDHLRTGRRLHSRSVLQHQLDHCAAAPGFFNGDKTVYWPARLSVVRKEPSQHTLYLNGWFYQMANGFIEADGPAGFYVPTTWLDTHYAGWELRLGVAESLGLPLPDLLAYACPTPGTEPRTVAAPNSALPSDLTS